MNGRLLGTCHVFLRSGAAGEGMDRKSGAGQNFKLPRQHSDGLPRRSFGRAGATSAATSGKVGRSIVLRTLA
jgi:hypothetical protein